VAPSTVVRDLGIYPNFDFSMRSQVSQTVSHCFAILRQLRSIHITARCLCRFSS